jgi:hypothetical protein
MESLLEMSHQFEEKGCVCYPYLQKGGFHSEASWEKMVPVFLKWMYPHLF